MTTKLLTSLRSLASREAKEVYMSTRKRDSIDLIVVSALCAGFIVLHAGESAAVVPEKASSQQEEIGSASFDANSSTVLALQ
jgi:hypothetical protein